MADNAFDEFKALMDDAGVAQDVEEVAAQDILGALGKLVEEKQKIETDIALLTAQLEEKQKELKDYDQNKIPNLIESAGLQEITTKNGYKVSVKQEYRGNISEENQEYALDWFIKSGGADTVKNKFEVPVSINDKKTIDLLEQIFNRAGVSYVRKLGIPWNTLAAVIRELDGTGQLENNEFFEQVRKSNPTMPNDLTLEKVLGVYKYKTTKVQKPKAKK
jgi:hypothetical protein